MTLSLDLGQYSIRSHLNYAPTTELLDSPNINIDMTVEVDELILYDLQSKFERNERGINLKVGIVATPWISDRITVDTQMLTKVVIF